jgi:uncharacterized protein YigE (DUF2233 family)
MIRSLPVLLAALAAGLLGTAVGFPAGARTGACAPLAHDGRAYTVCRFDPARDELRLFLRDRAGKPYGSFAALARDLEARGRRLVFAMNAGMYHADLSPVGLYVEDGTELKRTSTADGRGNFHLKPNGVFWLGGGKAGVLETGVYLAHQPKADFATQSGPMLVIDGELHPCFLKDATSRKIRNGVGVCGAGEVVFAISQERVTFHDFATLFRDRLACRNALYLDGTISSLFAPELDRSDSLFPMGPIVGATEP